MGVRANMSQGCMQMGSGMPWELGNAASPWALWCEPWCCLLGDAHSTAVHPGVLQSVPDAVLNWSCLCVQDAHTLPLLTICRLLVKFPELNYQLKIKVCIDK